MPKKIVVNGCSYTQEYHLQEKYRWSNLMGCDINLAHGGGSNDRIFHTTIEYINQNSERILGNAKIAWNEEGNNNTLIIQHNVQRKDGKNDN